MIMAKIIKRTDSLTEQPLISRLCRQLSPRGEAAKRLTIFAEENFVSKILCRQGEAAKRLTIFALLCASTMRQGKAYEIG